MTGKNITSHIYNYSSGNIVADPTHIKHRRQPSQFIGYSDLRAVNNMHNEILDNSTDEGIEHQSRIRALNPNSTFETVINVEIRDDNSIKISDNGRGMPCDVIPGEDIPGIYKILELEGAGSKGGRDEGDDAGYQSQTAGQHGTGSSVVKSLSEYFRVKTGCYSEKPVLNDAGEVIGTDVFSGVFTVEYHRGERIQDLTRIDDLEFNEDGTPKTFTEVEFLYDNTVLEDTSSGQKGPVIEFESVMTRIIYSLLSMPENVNVTYNFKYPGRPTETRRRKDVTVKDWLKPEINPNSGEDQLVKFVVEGNGYRSEIYLAYYNSEVPTQERTVHIANRMLMKESPLIRGTPAVIYGPVGLMINKYSPGAYSPDYNVRIAKYMKVLNIMSLKKASYNGQTKDHLVLSDNFVADFSYRFTQALNSPDFIMPQQFLAYKYIQEEVKDNENRKLREENLIKAKKKAEETLKTESAKEAKNILISKEYHDKQNLVMGVKPNKYGLAKTDSPVGDEQTSVIFVEGDSVRNDLAAAAEDQPISIVTLGGKIKNAYEKKDIEDFINSILSKRTLKDSQGNDTNQPQFIEAFYNSIMCKKYKALYFLTDADSDGLHIRILLIGLIMRLAEAFPEVVTDYISLGKVFIINAPAAKLQLNSDLIVDGRTYRAGTVFATSVSEMQALQRVGAVLIRKFTGLSDTVSDISARELVRDPKFHSQLLPPTQEERELIQNILTPSHIIKKEYASELATERAMISNLILKINPIDLPTERITTFPTNENPNLECMENIQYTTYSEGRSVSTYANLENIVKEEVFTLGIRQSHKAIEEAIETPMMDITDPGFDFDSKLLTGDEDTEDEDDF